MECNVCGKKTPDNIIVSCMCCQDNICAECAEKGEGFCIICNEEKEFWFDYFIKKLGKVILGGK